MKYMRESLNMELVEGSLTRDRAVEQDHLVDIVDNENTDRAAVAHEDRTSVIMVECHFCRICGEESKDLIYVFDGQGVLLNLAQKIRWHLPITVLEDDTLPTSVCYLCISRLDGCHEFANLSLQTEEKLTTLFSSASESEAVWKEIDQDLMTRNENTSQVETRRPAFPNDKLITAMSLLRQEKEKNKNMIVVDTSSDMSEVSKSTYETVTYGVENHDFVEEVVHVYNVSVDSEDVEAEPSNQWATEYEVKMRSEFDPVVNTNSVIICTRVPTSELHTIGDRILSKVTNNNSREVIYNEPSSSSDLHHRIHSTSLVLPDNVSYRNPMKACEAITETPVVGKQVDEEYRFICEHCGKGFRVRRTLNDHMAAHHSTNAPYKCDKCGRTFLTTAGWDLHKATHSTEEPYLCDICGKTFKHTSHLQSHKRSHLSSEKKHSKLCQHCGKGFRSQFHLGEHLNVHADRRPYECLHCRKAFHKRTQLRQHNATHLLTKPFKCPVCGTGFNRRGNMTEHVKRHKAPITLTCGICNRQFEQPRELRAHQKTHSTEELEKAMAERNGGKLFRCDVCAKAFAKRKGLIGHLPRHSNEKIHSCEFCGKKLSNRTTLAYHVRSMHTGERPYGCSFCTKAFVRAESRAVHERIHTGAKPFACSVCATGFRCNSSLAQHMKVHNEQPAIQCSVCSKRFLRKGALNVHMRTHTGERPFVCELCGKAFSQKNDMLKHSRKHVADKPHVCAACGDGFWLRRDLNRHLLGDGCGGQGAKAAEEAAIDSRVAEEELLQSLALDGTQNLVGVLHRF